jgi:hypothetical protein
MLTVGTSRVVQTVVHIKDGLWGNLAAIAFSLSLAVFAIWLVGFLHSTSMMKRRPVPEIMAGSFWVDPICLRTDFTNSPICFGVYLIANHRVTARE